MLGEGGGGVVAAREHEAVEELAEGLTEGVDDRLDRIARIYAHVTNEIRYVGLRPGEKLYEELMTNDEDLVPTAHEKIKVLKGSGLASLASSEWLKTLERLIQQGNEDALVQHMHLVVPEYRPSRRWASREEGIPSRQAAVGSGA